jgi:ribosomal protein L29
MAKAKEAKTTKKAPEIANKTVAELKADLLIAQKGLYDGTLANPHHIKAIRKEIARKLTAENAAKEKGNE